MRVKRFALWTIGFGALWLLLGEADPSYPALAVLLILGAAALGAHFELGVGWRVHLPALVRFIPFFVKISVVGGVDVALRAVRPGRALDPDLVSYPTRLPGDHPARIFLADLVSLIPGTVCVEVEDRALIVHLIDRGHGSLQQLARLEERVADLFGLPLGERS